MNIWLLEPLLTQNIQIFDTNFLIIGIVQNFVWSHTNDFEEWKSRLHCK